MSQRQFATFTVTSESYHMQADRSNDNRDARPAVTHTRLVSVCDDGAAVTRAQSVTLKSCPILRPGGWL